MLRLIVNKARQHFNDALEHAERGRTTEAIDELRNALDLDRRFINAHVVLGTLYAKNGDYDKARESWDAAMALSPELSKAHDYLQRVQTVEKHLPALKLYRWLFVGCLALCLVFVSALFVSLKEDPAIFRLRQAKELYTAGNYGRAIKELDGVRRNTDPGSAANLAADSLRLALQADLRQQVRRIQDLKFNQQFPEALAAIADLESRQPDNATSSAIGIIRQDIAHSYREVIDDLYQDFERGEVDFATLANQIDKFLRIYPESQEKEDLRSYRARARESEIERELATLSDNFEKDHDFHATAIALRDLVIQYSDSEAFATGRTQLIDEMLSWMFDFFQRRVDDRQFDIAEELLVEIEELSTEFKDVVDVTGPVELARRVLSDAQRAVLFQDAGEAVKSGDPAAWEGIYILLNEPNLSAEEMEIIARYSAELQTMSPEEEYRKLAALEQDYLKLQLSDEVCSKTLESFERIIMGLASPADRGKLLGYAAASAVKLGMKDLATSLTTRAQTEGAPEELVTVLRKLTAEKAKDESVGAAKVKIEPSTSPQPSDRRKRPAQKTSTSSP